MKIDLDLAAPEHDRNWIGCSDDDPINAADALTAGCRRCTLIKAARAAASTPESWPANVIARSRRILALVDDYHEKPTADTRSALRHALMDEFEAHGTATPPVAWRMVTPDQGNVIFLTNHAEAERFKAMDGREVRPLGFADGKPYLSDEQRRCVQLAAVEMHNRGFWNIASNLRALISLAASPDQAASPHPMEKI